MTLLKGASTADIWQIRGTERRWVPSMQVLNDCLGGSFTTISDPAFSEMKNTYRDGGPAACQFYAEGSRVKGASTGEIWLLRNRRRLHITSMEALRDCFGNGFQTISDLDRRQMELTYPYAGQAVCYPNGTLLKGASDPTIWLTYGGSRWAVPSMQMYSQCTTPAPRRPEPPFRPLRHISDDEAGRPPAAGLPSRQLGRLS